VLSSQFCHGLHFLFCINRPCRIGRRVQNQQFGLLCNGLSDALNRQFEIRIAVHKDAFAAKQVDYMLINDKIGIGDNHFITRID